VKKLLILIVASMASSLMLYALVSRDQPAKHSGLRAAELPPLISVHDLISLSDNAPDATTLPGPGTTVAWQQADGPADSFGPRLTLPQTNSMPGPLPTVLLINSGAAGVNGPNLAETARFLVNRGYAILEINCGDASSSGKMAVDLGAGVAGACTESTLADEARDLIEQGIADPDALAVLGAGAGATLALKVMAADPDLFKTAVVHSPVLYQTDRLYTGAVPGNLIKTGLKRGVSPEATDEHSASLASQSPIDLRGSVQGAVLMTRGNTDAIGYVDQAYARELMASSHDLEIYDFSGEDNS